MNGIKINDYTHRKQYSALMEELSDHDDLKVSMSFGNEWIGYNEQSKNMYVVLELPTHLSDDYTSLCLVARMEGGGAVIHYTATDEEGREEDFDDYEDLMEEDEEEEIPWCYENNKNAVCGCFEPCRLPEESDEEEEDDDDEEDEICEGCGTNFSDECKEDCEYQVRRIKEEEDDDEPLELKKAIRTGDGKTIICICGKVYNYWGQRCFDQSYLECDDCIEKQEEIYEKLINKSMEEDIDHTDVYVSQQKEEPKRIFH